MICQDEGLVPIVEPDIVMKGGMRSWHTLLYEKATGEHDLETAIAVNIEVQPLGKFERTRIGTSQSKRWFQFLEFPSFLSQPTLDVKRC